MIIHAGYNICSAWFLDIVISTCSSPKPAKIGGSSEPLEPSLVMDLQMTCLTNLTFTTAKYTFHYHTIAT